MNPKSTPTPPQGSPDRLTVLVFKDGFASRTFQIPVGWFTRFGLLAGLLASASVLAALAAVKYYRAAHRASPERVESLENELSDVRAAYKLLETKLAEKAAEQPKPTDSTAGQMTLAAAQQLAPAPIPTVTVTVTPAPVAAPVVAVQNTGSARALLFSALPLQTQPAPTDPNAIPIEMHSPHAAWSGHTLNVAFDLQYSRTDKGNQQGHIVILARGPETLLAYPENALNLSNRETLIAPERGEFFSVSRFRAVRAEFGSLKPGAVREIEILVFDANANLLIHSKMEPGKGDASSTDPVPESKAPTTAAQPVKTNAVKPAAPKKPKPAPKVEPKAEAPKADGDAAKPDAPAEAQPPTPAGDNQDIGTPAEPASEGKSP